MTMEAGSRRHPSLEDALVAVGMTTPDQTRATATVVGRLGLDPGGFVWHTSPSTPEAAGARSETGKNLIWVRKSWVTVHRQLEITVAPDGYRNGDPVYTHDGSPYEANSRGPAQPRPSENPVCGKCFVTHPPDDECN